MPEITFTSREYRTIFARLCSRCFRSVSDHIRIRGLLQGYDRPVMRHFFATRFGILLCGVV